MSILARPKERQPGFIGTLYPNGDIFTTNWEGEDASTTSLYSHVNDSSDSTWVQTDDIIMVWCSGTPAFREITFEFDNPSTEPNGSESTIVYVRAKLIGTGAAQSATLQFRQYDATTWVQDQSSTHSLTTSWAWYTWNMSESERWAYAETHNWSTVRFNLEFDICEDTGDSVQVAISQIYIDFSA